MDEEASIVCGVVRCLRLDSSYVHVCLFFLIDADIYLNEVKILAIYIMIELCSEFSFMRKN